ncbi:efflux RND transporter periplasmic adaptor subunit [Rhodopirellula sallentina]|uniref:efflux RND transporter periplasmic adaptor subunit n=1 Tax=Rhodopirellula sallentina TaxID=1263869 RepID=UPI000346E088|nr:efflux RND transporter periplasmic adaptor subunit [Rhodopirellula sallentina]
MPIQNMCPYVTLSFAVVLTSLFGCSEAERAADPIRPVRVVKVGDLEAITGRSFPGRASAKNDVDLSFQVSGPLVELPVDVGSVVSSGDTIAKIDSRDFDTALRDTEARLDKAKANLLAMERGARPEEINQLKLALKQAEASYEQAIAEHDRNAELVKSGAVSQSQFDITAARRKRAAAEVDDAIEALNIGMTGAREEDLDAKRAEVRSLEAAVTDAKNRLDDTTLAAPFDGEISVRYVDNFQRVEAKQAIVRIVDVSEIEIVVQVPESVIGLLEKGIPVTCKFDAIGEREFHGKVTKIGREASKTTRTYPVTVQIEQPDDANVLPGMAATVSIKTTGSDSTVNNLIIPLQAVFTEPADDSQSFVWVFDDATGKVSRRAVTLGELTPVGVRVTEGLKVGDHVVTAGINSLQEGQVVKLL